MVALVSKEKLRLKDIFQIYDNFDKKLKLEMDNKNWQYNFIGLKLAFLI